MKFGEISITDDIKILPYNNKKIVLVNKDDKPIRIQIPRMYMPFGISGFTPTGGGITKWNIDFSVKDQESFYNFIQNVENHIIQGVHQQSLEIFNRNISIEELKTMFNSNMKEDPRGVWEPKFRVKIDDSCFIFNEHEQSMSQPYEDHLYARNTGVSIIEPVSIYFMQRKFGITWKTFQLKMYEPQQLKGFQFRDA
tara:strand:+ start:2154 stop:2741 length:588 start_codon:yes stop_codon:yes gene_type:complete